MQLRQPKDIGQPLNSVYGLKYLWTSFFISGIHPPGVEVPLIWRVMYFLYAVVIIFACGFCFPSSMFVNLKFVESWQEIFGNLSVSMTVAASTLKQAAIVYNRIRLLKGNQYLHQLDERCALHPQDRMNILQGIRYCHVIYTAYTTVYMLCAIGYGYIAWVNRQSVYTTWFPMLFSSPEHNYVAARIFMSVSLVFLVFQNGSNDMYPLCYISLMIVQTRALGDRIKRMGKDAKLSQEENVQELKNCIQDHKNVQHFFNCIRPVISSTLFMQFCITAFVLCTTAINLIAFNQDFKEKVFSIVYFIIIVFQIFPVCMSVNILMEETSHLTTAMYSCNWIFQIRDFRKMLIIFMQRSQKQNVINAGNLAPVTLQTFLSIIKFSFSMFTIITQVMDKKN